MKREHVENVFISLNKPENLVIENLIKPDLPKFIKIRRDDGYYSTRMTTGKKLFKHIPAMYYFIHILLERQHTEVDSLRCWYAKDFVEMFSRDIEPVKSKNYFRFIWGILEGLKVIECHNDSKPNKYRKSAQAYFFNLGEKYSASVIVEHQVQVKKSIADKLYMRWNNKDNDNFEKIDISKLTSNKQMAHQYLALHNIRFEADLAKSNIDNLLAEKLLDINQYKTCQIFINLLRNKRIRTTHSQNCNRFYTPVNMMPKDIRSFIRDADGKGLIDLDFSSFNAFVVYKIINSSVHHYQSNAEKIAFEMEEELYRRLLSGGNFYTDFKEIFFPDEDLDRNQIKDVVLKSWFNARLNSRNKYRKQMLKNLPRITAVIDSLKESKYENFSNFAMTMESELVNDIIYKKFIDLYPDAIMYNLFDGFLVEQKYSALLQSMMQEEGSKYFDLNCFVKAKMME